MVIANRLKILASIGSMVALGWIMTACAQASPASQAVLTQPTTPPASPDRPQPPALTPVLQSNASLREFVHNSNRFRIQYPKTWQSFEQEDGVILVEPGDQAGLSVFFDDVRETYTADDLSLYLTNYVLRNFLNKESDFRPISQEIQHENVVVAQFSSTNDSRGETMSELRVRQQGTIVFIVLVNATTEQWKLSGDQLRRLADTFSAMDTGPTAPALDEEPEGSIWVLVGPDSKEFGFFRASDWQIMRLEENLVAVGHAETGMTFTASKFSWPNAAIDDKASEKAALEEIQTLATAHADLEHLPPQAIPLAGVTGSTIDFLYADADDTKIAGSVITAVNKGQMFKIVFTAPADIYDAALEWFNPMLRSFTFLSPEEIPLEELQTQ